MYRLYETQISDLLLIVNDNINLYTRTIKVSLKEKNTNDMEQFVIFVSHELCYVPRHYGKYQLDNTKSQCSCLIQKVHNAQRSNKTTTDVPYTQFVIWRSLF